MEQKYFFFSAHMVKKIKTAKVHQTVSSAGLKSQDDMVFIPEIGEVTVHYINT